MADDTVAALAHLGIEQADVFGYGMEAGAALRIAPHPEDFATLFEKSQMDRGSRTYRPSSQLAILPGTSHVTVVDRADLLLSVIPPFLDAPMPEPA